MLLSSESQRQRRWVSAVLVLLLVVLVASCVVIYLTSSPIFWRFSLWAWLAIVAILVVLAVLSVPFARTRVGRALVPAAVVVVLGGGFLYGALIPTHASTDARISPARQFPVGDGTLVLRPSLKYEVLLSLHVIRDPEHHRGYQSAFVSAVQALPRGLGSDIDTYLRMDDSQWEAAFRDAPVSNDMDDFLRYSGDNFHDYRWNAMIRRYWEAFFQNEYGRNYAMLEESSQTTAALLQASTDRALRDPFGYVEEMTGYSYTGPRRLILVPSRYAAPHTFGFDEKGGYVVIYDATVSSGWRDAFGSIYHDALDPMLRHLQQDKRMGSLADRLKRDMDLSTKLDGTYKSGGPWSGWIQENMNRALSAYLEAKSGIRQAAELQRGLTTNYARQLFLALLTDYQPGTSSMDDFLMRFTESYAGGT